MVLLGPLHSNNEDRGHRAPLSPLPKVQSLVDPTPDLPTERVHKGHPEGQNTSNPLLLHYRETVQTWLFQKHHRAKASYRADFLVKASPNNIWTAKQLVPPRKTPRFPSLPDASGPGAINTALLDHFFPPKDPLPSRGPLKRNPSACNNPLLSG